jgi:hypothetical protein
MPVPYYDCADHRLLNVLTDAVAERYLSEGIAHAIRSKKGRIVRLYSIAKQHVHGSVSAAVASLHAASRTTRTIHGDGVRIREHREPQPMTGSPRTNVPLVNLDIALHGVPELTSGSCWNSDEQPAELSRTLK